ncbi:hypothetical protein U0E10_03395 [Burkholderia ubonensis]|uniref:hypothetical protein n=1 Tax=Burkholderia ubonensis TaxID=101571 RepID=UPI002AB43D1F|nr:hypothetical protein [Burkholderia ubonensis]MDY7786956.1 hypothetical protein [Burkholderia ubonensis]
MPFDRAILETAIQASGGGKQPEDQVNGLLVKLRALEAADGRYGALLNALANVNDEGNLRSLIFEATFAYQFEAAGMVLEYEVKQAPGQPSSIDFRLNATSGQSVFFELRLLQQDQATADEIATQLRTNKQYAVMKDGRAEADEIIRLQSIILAKVQKPDGTPIKFFDAGPGVVNIVVVAISDILLETADMYDCILSMYGDSEVPVLCRRGVFGMFQDVKDADPAEFQAFGARFGHAKGILHGVLFLFRPRGSGVLDYQLQQFLVWNRALVSQMSVTALEEQMAQALPKKE